MQLTPEERASQTLTPENSALATQLVKMNGYVLIENVLPPDLLARLQGEFQELLDRRIARADPNRGTNRYQMHLPFREPFHDAAVIANPYALPLIDALLGENVVCHYFASDTPLPGSDFQAVHSDIERLFPETNLSLPAYSLAVNFPLVDFTPENGPLEIWPGGTHLFPGDGDMRLLAPLMPSQKALMPAGSLLLRDLRMWHRGTPNQSDAPRPNLALIYSRPWLKTHYPPIAIPQPTYDALSDRARRLFRFEAIGAALSD